METFSVRETIKSIRQVLLEDRWGMAAMAVPALCFTFQNVMNFVTLDNLDITTAQVMSLQFAIL